MRQGEELDSLGGVRHQQSVGEKNNSTFFSRSCLMHFYLISVVREMGVIHYVGRRYLAARQFYGSQHDTEWYGTAFWRSRTQREIDHHSRTQYEVQAQRNTSGYRAQFRHSHTPQKAKRHVTTQRMTEASMINIQKQHDTEQDTTDTQNNTQPDKA